MLNSCWRYKKRKSEWVESGKMREDKGYVGAAFHPGLGLAFTGGFRRGQYLKSAEFTPDGLTFFSLPNLPSAKAEHCAAVVRDGAGILVTGNRSGC